MLKLKTVAALAACACVVALTACGSDDDGEGAATASSSSGSSAGVTKAKELVAEQSKTPTSINVDEPLEGKPAPGKTIVQLKCSVPECQEIYDGLAESAKVVGWTTKDVNMGPTPEEVNQAFDQALALNPSAIVISGIPLAVWQTSADKAKAAGVPVLNISSTDKATGVDGNGIVATINGAAVTGGMGEMTGNFAVADSDGKANVALFTVPDFPTLKPWADETQKAIKANCPDCKSKIVDAEVGDIGSKLPQTIVSTIQQDPDITHVALAFGGMSTGVRPALNEAGFNKVKIIGEGSVASNLEALRQGNEQMWAAQVSKMQGWYANDILLRHFNDQPLGKLENDLIYPTQILTPDNAPEGKQYLEPADYQAQFKKLWGVGLTMIDTKPTQAPPAGRDTPAGAAGATPAPAVAGPAEGDGRPLIARLLPVSSLFVWAALIVLFAILVPETFPTTSNLRIVLSNEAISAVVAMGLLLPLAARQYDLSIAGVMSLSVAVVGSLMSNSGWSPTAAILATLLLGAGIGAINAFVIVKLRVDSFIATLGMTSILAALTYRLLDGQDIVGGIPQGFTDLGQSQLFGIPLPVYYMAVLAAVLYVRPRAHAVRPLPVRERQQSGGDAAGRCPGRQVRLRVAGRVGDARRPGRRDPDGQARHRARRRR